MKIWLIHLGELLPIDGDVRLFRYGILAEILVKRGHQVTRWAPTFIHAYKCQRYTHDQTVILNKNYHIELLYAEGYSKNISLNRVRFHRQLGQAFNRKINQKLPPDIILAGIPTPNMCLAALRYAQKQIIPLVVDVRDLWPDIYLTIVPKQFHKIARWVLWPAFRTNQKIFQGATAIFGVSKSYLDWGLKFAGRNRREADDVFPLGYPESIFPPETIKQEQRNLFDIKVDPQKMICCFFGQFEFSYDLETVIYAARQLQNSGYNQFQFVLCGDGVKMARLRKLSTGLNNVIFPGWISTSTIHALMQISKIGLVAYSKETLQSLPNKPIEYLSAGLPILSTLKGELEMILKKNNCGITYKAKNAKELIRNLIFLINHPEEVERMGRNARRLFEERFTADHVYSAMIAHLERIANGELWNIHCKR